LFTREKGTSRKEEKKLPEIQGDKTARWGIRGQDTFQQNGARNHPYAWKRGEKMTITCSRVGNIRG